MKLTRKVEGDCIQLADDTNVIFTMKEIKEDNYVTVILEGSLRSDVVYDFQDEMVTLALFGLDLKLNFSAVTYLSSACAKALLEIQQKMDSIGKGSLVLLKIPEVILKELESTGLSELLMIED